MVLTSKVFHPFWIPLSFLLSQQRNGMGVYNKHRFPQKEEFFYPVKKFTLWEKYFLTFEFYLKIRSSFTSLKDLGASCYTSGQSKTWCYLRVWWLVAESAISGWNEFFCAVSYLRTVAHTLLLSVTEQARAMYVLHMWACVDFHITHKLSEPKYSERLSISLLTQDVLYMWELFNVQFNSESPQLLRTHQQQSLSLGCQRHWGERAGVIATLHSICLISTEKSVCGMEKWEDTEDILESCSVW